MVPLWLGDIAAISLVVGFLCAIVVAIDLVRHPQPMWIMNAVWPITALYLGPIAIWAYVRFSRATRDEMHKMHGMHNMHAMHGAHRPFWQTVVVETTHCGAGCTLGDVIGEFVIFFAAVTLFSSHLITDYIFDFVLAYIFGVFFQYFAIAPMRGLSFWPGIRAAVAADTISLTAFEIGLFAWMWVMTLLPFHHMLTPITSTYWFMMQIGMAIGFLTSYPANWWLVRAGIKEPM